MVKITDEGDGMISWIARTPEQKQHDKIKQLETKNKELKLNLLEFGRHSEGCNYPHNKEYGCKCGWLKIEQALKGGK